MKLAIMQPYFFPYLGYFQLINFADIFVFYDDVNYIKGGWINRNIILNNNKNGYFTLCLNKSSSNKKIKDIEILDNKDHLLKALIHTYKKTPYFDIVISIFEQSLYSGKKRISEINYDAIVNITNYLDLQKEFYKSSEVCPQFSTQSREDRIISICLKFNADQYINMINGRDLYSNEIFEEHGINLVFFEPILIPYRQFDKNFRSGLSIIDALMFNSPQEIRVLLTTYKLYENVRKE